MNTKTSFEQEPNLESQAMSDREHTIELMQRAKKYALENRDPKTALVALALKRFLERTEGME